MQHGKIIYRLKNGNPQSWQVPISKQRMNKKVEIGGVEREVPMYVAYYPGSTSPFVDDHRKGAYKKKNIWLTDQGNGFTEFHADEDDFILNNILQNNQAFNKLFFIYDPDAEAEREYKMFVRKDKIRDSIIGAKDYEAKGMAFGVFGYIAYSWSPVRCKSELMKRLDQGLKEGLEEGVEFISKRLDSGDYSSKLLAGAAYHLGIVEENQTSNFVQWSDTGEHVLSLSIGEIGVEKFANFLAFKSDESARALQRLGEAIEGKKNRSAVNAERSDIETLQDEYLALYGVIAPVRYKNDSEWLTTKINEKKNAE